MVCLVCDKDIYILITILDWAGAFFSLNGLVVHVLDNLYTYIIAVSSRKEAQTYLDFMNNGFPKLKQECVSGHCTYDDLSHYLGGKEKVCFQHL